MKQGLRPGLKHAWSAIAWLCLAVAAFGQLPPPHYSVRTWTRRDGLPSNEINALLLDRNGYLLVGTTDGLVRFDGATFTPVLDATGASTRLRGFIAMAENPRTGDLLIAPRSGGLTHLGGNEALARTLPAELAGVPIEALLYEDEQTLWLGFKGGTVLRQHATTVQRFDSRDGLSLTDPVQFARGADSTVWIASGNFLGHYAHEALVRVTVGRGGEKVRLATARQDGPWVLVDEHLNKIENGALHERDKINSSMSAYYVQALLEDASGNLWVATRSRGLRRWDASGDVRNIVQVPEDITALLEDAQGNIWAGSKSGGIIRISAGVTWMLDRHVGFLENHSPAVCEDASEHMWFANRDGGIAWLDENGRVPVVDKPRAWDRFSAISVTPHKDGGVWASTTYGLLAVNTRGIVQRIDTPDFSGAHAPAVLYTARNGDLWAALEPAGVARVRDGAVARFGVAEGASPALVRTIAEDADGAIWFGSEDGRLDRWENDRVVPVRRLDTNVTGPIQALHFDASGVGWVGTERGGLCRIDASSIRTLTARDGLVSDNITQIASADDGALWLGSPAGIFHLPKDELASFLSGTAERVWPVVVGPDEGVAEATCLSLCQPAVWRSHNGVLWFVTRQGVVAADPARERAMRATLRTQIESVRVDGKKQPTAHDLRVPAGAREIEIRFSPLCLTTPANVRTRFRLADFETGWSEPATPGLARYYRVPPGRYRFEVVSFIAGRRDTESKDVIAFQVQAAWWQTWTFRIAAALIAIVGLVLAVRAWSHRRLRQRLARLKHDSALERERARIARNIHDDLGAGLTRITLLTQSHRAATAEAQFNKIYDVACALTQSMDEIVWAINPKNDELEKVAGYITEFAQSYLADAGLGCRVLIPDELPDRKLTAQFRHHLFLACKEALNNVVKHARATHVVLEFVVEGDALRVTLTDDGIGLGANARAAAGGNGLANMHSRMKELGGAMTMRAREPSGTVVVLTANLISRPAV